MAVQDADFIAGGLADWLRDVGDQGHALHPPYAPLSKLLLPLLDPTDLSRHDDEHYDADMSPNQRPPDLSALTAWGSRAVLPKATCILSESTDWRFDLQNSSEALYWVLSRSIEHRNLKCLPSDAAFANFPSSTVGTEPTSSTFGPFNGVGLIMNLKSCEDLSPELVRLSIPARVKWLQYLNRYGEPIHVTGFPPITYAVAVMVGEREFTDKVAMDLYSFFNCSIDLHVGRGLLPSFGAMSDSDCEPAPLRNGVPALDCLNGATVLFIACLVLRAERAVQKLLDMEKTGRIILSDMAEYGLLWMMRAQDIRAVIGRWLEQTDYHLTFPPPHSKLLLLLRAWVSRHGGPTTAGTLPSSLLLFHDAETLVTDNHHSTALDPAAVTSATGADSCTAGQIIASGVFYGCAAGTAIAVHLHARSAPSNIRGTTSPAHTWVNNLFGATLRGSRTPLISEPAIAVAKTYLKQLLGAATPRTIRHVDRPRIEVLSRVRPPSPDQPENLSSQHLFLRHFYRAFFVSVTGGRLRDDSENPLEWSDGPLKHHSADSHCPSGNDVLLKANSCSSATVKGIRLPPLFDRLFLVCTLFTVVVLGLWLAILAPSFDRPL